MVPHTSNYVLAFFTYRPSHCASVKGCIDTVKLLDKAKADLWGPSSRGDCPVHEAAQGGHCGKSVIPYIGNFSCGFNFR